MVERTVELAWLIPILPFAAFVLISFGSRPWKRISGFVAVLGTLAAFILALPVFAEVLGGARLERQFDWLPLAGEEAAALHIGYLVDPLAAVMLLVVTSVSFLVIFYSQGYMRGDPGYSRYFAFISLFCMSMLGLVLANNLLALYLFWELVGLCSYLLIGFWYQKPEAAAAAKKAFIVTRLGDFGLLAGILLLWNSAGTLQFTALEGMIHAGRFDPAFLSLVAVLIFCGAVGKSAQFPLHVWLPDAMEGPTPVSALIHAATMVAAGVYLVARTFPIFEAGPASLTVVMVIGTITLVLAATMAMVNNDIKRVMAYSTVSQLGYMMLALGVGARTAAVFHLMNHAFFKALLFLAAGSVIHALGTQDLRAMGGLRHRMRITSTTMLIAALSLSGFPFITSGFWSKDEILTATFARGEYLVYTAALLTAFLTAFYMFRAWFLCFWGEPRSAECEVRGAEFEVRGAGSDVRSAGSDVRGADPGSGTDNPEPRTQNPELHTPHSAPRTPHHEHSTHHSAEPWVMALPLIALAVPSLLSGFWGSPLLGNGFATFLEGHPEPVHLDLLVMGSSIVAALGGIGLAWKMYGDRSWSAEWVSSGWPHIYYVLRHNYGFDEAYNRFVRVVVLGLARLLSLFDERVIDGAVNGVAFLTRSTGLTLRRLQTGQLQNYGWAMYAGALVIAVVTLAMQFAR